MVRGPQLKERTFSVTTGDEWTPEMMREWRRAQEPYPNLADNPRIAQAALGFVQDHLSLHKSATSEIYDLWESIDYELTGNTLSHDFAGSDIHCASIYRAIKRLVPRVEKALFAYDPWFQVKARRPVHRTKAVRRRAWIDYLLDQSGVFEHKEMIIRSALVRGFAVVKTRWETRFDKRVYNHVTKRFTDNGRTVYDFKPEEQNRLVYEGMEWDLVDQVDFLVDPDCDRLERAGWIGDRTHQHIRTLEQWQESGMFLNVEKIEESDFVTHRETDRMKQASNRTTMRIGGQESKAKGGEPKVEVVEIWARWDPEGKGDYDDYVITVAANRHCLRIQKNPHIDKRTPYCLARLGDEAHHFYATGIVDHALNTSIERDNHRNWAMKNAGAASCPQLIVGSDWDGPDSIFNAEPGQVMRSDITPHVLRMPSTMDHYPVVDHMLEESINDIMGTPAILSGANEGTGTATGDVARIREANESVYSIVKATGRLFHGMAAHADALSRQYVTFNKMFGVSGAAERDLRSPWQTVSPEDFQDPVAIEIRGVEELRTQGMRASQIAAAVQQTAPFLPVAIQQGEVNVTKLVRKVFEYNDIPLEDEILRIEPGLDELMAPQDENDLMRSGFESVEVHAKDDHKIHEKLHKLARARATKDGDIDAADRIQKHINEHEKERRRKAFRRRAMEQPADAMHSAGDPAQQTMPGRGTDGRTPDLLGDALGQQGNAGRSQVAPGPPSAATTAAPGRMSALHQEQNHER